ncbi:UPF0462 protein C4orf33 homolog isoform X3 [Narcine bancroftii]|uniref:UPF0462 protein C4orf33 homolog isoform X3 n=1 Tax=Narcine bancroftii TaxID=1343680 RepID=UPI00383173AE
MNFVLRQCNCTKGESGRFIRAHRDIWPARPLTGQCFQVQGQHQIVEAFFLNSCKELYLEVELCPHGQHLVLLLAGRGKAWKKELDLKYDAAIHDQNWEGKALLPWSYFPDGVNKFNAYAIHGSGDKRVYEALFPIPKEQLKGGQQPNFHRLEYFEDFSLSSIMGDKWKQPLSHLWKSVDWD